MSSTAFTDQVVSQISQGARPLETLTSFRDAYNYDAATSISWLTGKLGLIRHYLAHHADGEPKTILTSEQDFLAWV